MLERPGQWGRRAHVFAEREPSSRVGASDGPPLSTSPSPASVRVGGYSLELGTQAGSFARFEPEQETENAEKLAAALDEEPEEQAPAVAAIQELQESAEAVTGRIEEADSLLRRAAEGTLLDPANLTGEIDSLLDLCERLDKAGRFEEQLALMRSLNGLLALARRWLELIRSLRSLLRSAEAHGHRAGQAWAHHELGSLHLCAGRAKKASEHLRKALRVEEQLGDLAGRCATRHNLDAAERDVVQPYRGGEPPRRALRLAALAAAFIALGAGGTSIAFALGGGGGSTTTDDASVAFTVDADFEPDDARASVSVSVRCSEGGAPDASPKRASESSPALFAVSGFGAGSTCTATVRRAPSGYTVDASDCLNVPVTGSDSPSCTLTGRRKNATSVIFTVTKDFAPDDPSSSVTVRVNCTNGGRPDASPKRLSEGTPASFTIRGFGRRATCTAAEGTVPAGYTSNDQGCRAVAITAGRPAACTIINTRKTPTSVTFTVAKDFEPDDAEASVSITVSCTGGGTPDSSSKPAREGTPAVFKISGFDEGATCTATEGDPPAGSTSDEADCDRVAIATRRSCSIVNTLTSATLSVGRTFSDGNTSSVAVGLVCDSGAVEPRQGIAREGSPAVFTITGFTTGTTCTATGIKAPSGYDKDESDCENVQPADVRECTISYTERSPG